MLDSIDFSQDMPELLQLDFFERTQIEQVISNCEHVNEQGHTVCNVKVSCQFSSSSCFFFFVFDSYQRSHIVLFFKILLTAATQSAGR